MVLNLSISISINAKFIRYLVYACPTFVSYLDIHLLIFMLDQHWFLNNVYTSISTCWSYPNSGTVFTFRYLLHLPRYLLVSVQLLFPISNYTCVCFHAWPTLIQLMYTYKLTHACPNWQDYYTVRFIKPYRNPVYRCNGSRQGFMNGIIF